MSMRTSIRSRIVAVGLPVLTAGVLTASFAAAPGAQAAGTAGSSGGPAMPAAAVAATTSLMVSSGHLTDGTGRTVYLWTADTGGMSTCNGACASIWPPLPSSGTPTAGPGVNGAMISTISRSDGTKQLAYAGHPLYYYAGDRAPGQTNGQGSNGFGALWWMVSPAGQQITTTGGGATPAPSGPSPTTPGRQGY